MVVSIGDFELRVLDAGIDLGDWSSVEGYYRDLGNQSLSSVEALEAWLLDLSELDAWLDEEGSVRYVEMTCQTDDAEREKRYLSFIEDVVPNARAWSNKLDRKFLDCEHRAALRPDRYGVLIRRIENRVALFRDENIPLQTEDEKLCQKYQKVVGALTAEHDGRERTMQEMARYLQETDRAVRQEAWEKITAKWAAVRDEIESIYDEMVAVRHKIALNAGLADYREYAFREKERFDYTPEDCQAFAFAIEATAVPAARGLAEERKRLLGVDTLRPWDMAADPRGRPPLRPFDKPEELISGCAKIFEQVEPILGEQFARMRREELLNLASRKGKAPGGYMIVYEGRRLPFIFMNAVGTERDVQTLLHEGGHAFHGFAARDEALVSFRNAPIEFAEVASMSMELLGGKYMDAFYDETDQARSAADNFDGIIRFFPYMAMVDMFQHWVYTHPKHARDERKQAWLNLERRFAGSADYSGYEDVLPYLWHRKMHPFTVPFYYVEYGIAQLGALGVWLNSRRDYAAAVRDYRSALALGGSRPLPELFEAAGVRFDFTETVLRPAVEEMQKQLATLDKG